MDWNGRVETFETAVKYHFYHTLAIFLTGILVTMRNEKDSMVMLPSSRNEANIRSARMHACCAPAASSTGAKARPNWPLWPCVPVSVVSLS